MQQNGLEPVMFRVSVGQEGDNASPERQRSNIERMCLERRFIPEFYEDITGHNSGTKRGKRKIGEMEHRL